MDVETAAPAAGQLAQEGVGAAAAMPPAESVLSEAAEEKSILAEAAPAPAPGDGAAKSDAPAAPPPLDLKLPQGLDEKNPMVASFREAAAEVGLDSEKAQTVLDAYLKAEASRREALFQTRLDEEAAWLKQLREDKEIGQDNWESTQQHIRRAMNFVGREVAEVLDSFGLGNHPTLVRAFVRLGKAQGEDSVAGLGASAASTRSPEDALRTAYPTMFSKE